MRALITIILILIAGVPLCAQNPGDQVFSEPKIFEVRFHFDQEGYLDSLHKSHETGDYISGNVTIDGVVYDQVGVRFKGHSSYMFYPGDKKPFRIKFNKFKDHRFDGMKTISLNNGWGDPTMLREKLHLDFLREQGIPAPRANFARVYIDSVYWGFYSLVEHVDKIFLDTHLGDNDGNLYKAEKSTLEWKGMEQENYYQDLELKTNEKENDWSDLVHFLDVLNHTPETEFQQELEIVFNPDPYLKAWATDNLFVNLDSYLGSAANYYLYRHSKSGQFEWIVWDVNLTLAARHGSSDLNILYTLPQRPLMYRIIQVNAYKLRYLEIMQTYLQYYFREERLYTEIDKLARLILKDYRSDEQKMYSNDEITRSIEQDVSGIPGLKPFISERRSNVLSQLELLGYNVNYLEEGNSQVPEQARLYANYPNPFNPRTTISFQLPKAERISIEIYNVLGQKIITLFGGIQKMGTHSLVWNGVNDRGNQVPSGLYFCQLKGVSVVRTIKMMYLK